ncbi:MAG TPA: pilin [Candidatus Saccharimonadales bacterium]|nr:pilin [Candidatus Saccharimonadales bacterium]
MLQKLKGFSIILLFALGTALPLLAPVAAQAAAKVYPAGTCWYNGPGGSKPHVKCSTLGISGKKDTDGNTVNIAKSCYEVDATTSSSRIIHVNCDGTTIGGTSSTPSCGVDSNGQPTPCSTAPATDPALTGGSCASVAHCDLIIHYVNPIINLLAALVGIAVVASIIIGGVQYGSSAGDPQKVSAAKARIRNAIIALLTFFFLYGLLNFLLPSGLFR